MFCGNCGHQNLPGTRFCESCGQQIVQAARPTSAGSGAMKRYTDKPEEKKKRGSSDFELERVPPGMPYHQEERPTSPVILWIRHRLSFLGGVAILIGFLMPFKTGGKLGVQLFIDGLYRLGPLFEMDMQAKGAGNYALQTIVLILLALLPITALVSFFALTGAAEARKTGVVFATASLVDFALVLFGVLFGTFASFFSGAGTGTWWTLGGLLWMVFMPMFAPAERD